MKFPKPVKKPKAPRRPIQRRRAKRNRRPTTASFAFPRPETPAGGKERRSAHSRRTRAWGKMAFLRTRGCDVRGALISLAQEAPVGEEMDRWVTALEALPPCRGGTQVMHLGWKADPGGRRQAHDADTAGGCELHHAEMGTKLGGLGTWYVGLGREGQRILRRRLQDRGQAAWDALAPEERAEWDRRAEADRAARRRA